MLNDIRPENIRAAVDYTLEYGTYSQGSAARPRGKAESQYIPEGKRAPNTVRPWSEESAGYKCLDGDIAAVERAWKTVDSAAYNYIWTTVLW